MRWPEAKTKKTKKTKKTQKPKINKKKQKISKNELFSYQSKISYFLVPQKTRTPKTLKKNRGFGKPIFEKQLCVTKRPSLDKKTQIQKFQLSFLFAFFFSFNNKKHKNLLEPLFLYCFSKPKKENLQEINLKQRNLKKNYFCTFLKKAIFRKLANNWTQKKAHKMRTEQKKSPETPIFIVRKQTWPRK